MNGWWILLPIVLLVLSYPLWRFLIKRVIMWIKLKRACKRCGARLRGTHFLWIFARRKRRGYDCIIERDDETYKVKLFATHRRACHVIFTEDGRYMVRHFLALFGNYQKLVMPLDTKPRILPISTLSAQENDKEVPQKRILLVHPVCMQLRRDRENIPLTDGDTVGSMTLYSLSGLIRLITE